MNEQNNNVKPCKLIAHRGACLEAQENTLEAMNRGAAYGAYAVECDPRFTKDGVCVLFHDDDLRRLAGDPARVCDLTLAELRTRLAAAGKTVTTLDELFRGYTGASAVLFDLPSSPDEALLRRLADAPFHAVMGVHAVNEAQLASRFFAPSDILAFMPDKFLSDPSMPAAFAAAGAGNIRLWEPWVDAHPIETVRGTLPAGREIWIMSADRSIRHPLFCMNGSPAQIDRLLSLGADGILLNDIAGAVSHLQTRLTHNE